MDSLVFEGSRPESPARSLDWGSLAAPLFLGLFLITFVFVRIGNGLGAPEFLNAPWAGAALLGLAAASSLVSLARQLPWQNVLLGTVLIALMGAATEVVVLSIGSGLGSYGLQRAPFRPGSLWELSLAWVVAILNCRGVIRLVLRRWRFASNYGFWVLGATVVWTVLFVLNLGRFRPVQWQTPSTGAVIGCAMGALITVALVTPSLINKKPVSERANWHPLVIWLAFNLWFVAGAIEQGRWLPGVALLSQIFAMALFATYGKQPCALAKA